jgi:hypothetical protein
MKIIRNLFASATAQQLVFAGGCVVMLGAGWGTKVAVDRIGSIHDDFERDMKLPSQQYLHDVARQDKSLAAGQPANTPPAKEAVKRPMLP